MVNTQYLEKKIDGSGLRRNYINDQLGITRQAFMKKAKNIIKFRASEIYVLCDLLKLSEEEKSAIFFADEVNS